MFTEDSVLKAWLCLGFCTKDTVDILSVLLNHNVITKDEAREALGFKKVEE